VRAPSLVRRREIILPRMASGRPLIRSTPPPSAPSAPSAGGSSWSLTPCSFGTRRRLSRRRCRRRPQGLRSPLLSSGGRRLHHGGWRLATRHFAVAHSRGWKN
jgi:hypothetical protein